MTDTDHQHQHRHHSWQGHEMGALQDPGRYERIAARFANRLYRRVARDVAALGLPDGARVLDVGTGPGVMPRLVAAASPGLQIDAVDLSPEMIAWAQQTSTPGVTFTVADVAALPWPDATFDLVVSSISQHHWADPDAGMGEIRRVLRPGGVAWVYDFRWALGRAESAAAPLRPGTSVTRERTSWLSPVGRLVLRPA